MRRWVCKHGVRIAIERMLFSGPYTLFELSWCGHPCASKYWVRRMWLGKGEGTVKSCLQAQLLGGKNDVEATFDMVTYLTPGKRASSK